jgi:FkbM family methyltransferase
MDSFRKLGWDASRLISQNGGPVSKALYLAARTYSRAYVNLNYDMKTNGEFYLLDRLCNADVSTIFDVGANKGEYALACLGRIKQAQVHCFEIVPATFSKLSRNVSSPNVRLNNFGLSDAPGELVINYSALDDGSSSLIEGSNIHRGDWQKIAVKVVSGDSYVRDNGIRKIDWLKVDVEGAEHLVFQGFSNSFDHGLIGAVQFEFGMVNIYSKVLLKDFWSFFEARGFVIGPVMPKGVKFRRYDTRDEDFQGPPNFVAVHTTRQDILTATKID